MPYKDRVKRNAANRKSYNKYRDTRRAQHRKYAAEHRERHRKNWKRWYRDHKNKVRDNNLVRCYGITLVQYNKMVREQDGKCAICGTHQLKLAKTLGVDHNHNTSKVRGLLCAECNSGIGKFKDSVKLLRCAIQYLKRFEKRGI